MLVSFLVCCYSIILDFIAFLCLCAASFPSAHFRVDRNCPLPCLASYYLAANEWVKAEKNRIASNYNRVQAAPRNLDPRQVPQGMIGRLQVVWLDIVCKKKNKIQVKKAWPTSAKCTPFEVNIKHVIMGCMVQVAHSDSVLSIIVAISKLLARLGNTQGVLQRLLRLQRDWVTLSLFSLLWWRGRL